MSLRSPTASCCPVVQINTGANCHLDAQMLEAAMRELDPPARSLLMIGLGDWYFWLLNGARH